MKLLKERSIVALSFFVVLSLLAIVPSSYAEISEDILEYCHNKSSTTAEYIKCITEELNKRKALEGKDVKDLKGYTQNRQKNTISTQVVVSRNKDSGLLGYGPVFEGRINFNSCSYEECNGGGFVNTCHKHYTDILYFVADKINPYFDGYRDGDWITITSSIPVTGSFNISYNRFSYYVHHYIDYVNGRYISKNRKSLPPINVYAYKDNQLLFSQENINGGVIQLPEIEEPAYLTIKIYAPIGFSSPDSYAGILTLLCSYSEVKFITLSRVKSDQWYR